MQPTILTAQSLPTRTREAISHIGFKDLLFIDFADLNIFLEIEILDTIVEREHESEKLSGKFLFNSLDFFVHIILIQTSKNRLFQLSKDNIK